MKNSTLLNLLMNNKFINILQQQYFPQTAPSRYQLGLWLTPILIAIVLLVLDRYGLQRAFFQLFAEHPTFNTFSPNELLFVSQVHFSTFCLLLFVIVPIIFHFLFPIPVENALGLSVRYCRPHIPIYIFLLVVMIPIIWIMASQTSFQSFYPMYKPESLSLWLFYEFVYMLQFFAIEFFFRGFALIRLEQIIGKFAIVVMVIPYSLLHIHKPFPEALASIVAGLVLGYLALKSRSIWPGLFVHCGVAFSMDCFSLVRSGRMIALW